MRISEITLFPLKSARGIPLQEAEIEARGLRGDRRWVVADPTGRFVSQRELPSLARLVAEPSERGLALSFDGERREVEAPGETRPPSTVTIWGDALPLVEAPEAADWLSRIFARSLRLFFQPDRAVRRVDPEWSRTGDQVSLADGFPLLIATTATLTAVERAVGKSVGMRRFRPSLVVDGVAEGDEDRWARIRVGAVELELVKPCARCTVTTVDQERGVFTGDEPLAALRRIRTSNDRRVPGVLFGWNAVPRLYGRVRVGDEVAVLEARSPWPLRRTSVPIEA